MTKKCPKCKQNKPFPENFYKGRKKKDGSHYYMLCCRKCYCKQIQQTNLKKGKTKTLQGIPTVNLTGKKFGKLTALKEFSSWVKLIYSNMNNWV